MLRTSQRRLLRLITQMRRKNEKKNKEDFDGNDVKNEEVSEDAQEEDSTNAEYYQYSSISFEDDAKSTSSQEDESEYWIAYMKRSAREAHKKC